MIYPNCLNTKILTLPLYRPARPAVVALRAATARVCLVQAGVGRIRAALPGGTQTAPDDIPRPPFVSTRRWPNSRPAQPLPPCGYVSGTWVVEATACSQSMYVFQRRLSAEFGG